MSGHKFGPPKGIACLWVKKDTNFHLPYLGTPPIPLIYSFAETLKFTNIDKKQKDIKNKLKFFKGTLNELAALNNIKFEYNTQTENTIPNIISLRFFEINAFDLLMHLSDKNINVSVGSACNAKSVEPSHVLTEMGLSISEALSTLRISISETNTYAELKETIATLIKIITNIYNDRSKFKENY